MTQQKVNLFLFGEGAGGGQGGDAAAQGQTPGRGETAGAPTPRAQTPDAQTTDAQPSDAPEIDAPETGTPETDAPETGAGQDEAQSDLAKEQQARFAARAASLARSIAQTAQIYPQFDLHREMENPRFLRLIDAGLSVRETYETLHRDELLRLAVEQSTHAARQAAYHAMAARRSRPEESGASPAIVTRPDPAAMSRRQREEISRRVLRGERVTF